MQSFLFVLKVLVMMYGLGWLITFFIEPFAYYFIVALTAIVISVFIHLYSQDSKWEEDYIYLLFKTKYRKFLIHIKRSKEKMRNELKDE